MFILKVITNPQSDLLSPDFYRDFVVNFMGNVRRAVFYSALPLSSNLALKVPDLLNHLIHSIVCSPGLINVLEKIYGELRVRQTTKYQQEILDAQIFQEYTKLFFRYITIDSGKLLYQIGKNAADLPSFFFNNLIQKIPANFLCVYCLLKKIFVTLDIKTKQEVKTVVSASENIYVPKSREESINSIITDKVDGIDDCVNFLIAASETDDVDSIRNEYAEILNGSNKQ